MRSYHKPRPGPNPAGADVPAPAFEKYVPDPVDQLLAAPIQYHVVYAHIAGQAAAGLFLSHLIHQTRASDERDSWVTKSRREWLAETALTPLELDRARKAVRAAGLLEEGYAGRPPRPAVRVNEVALAVALANAAGRSDAAR